MTIYTSATLGTITQILGSGQFAGGEVGRRSRCRADSKNGGVLVGGATLYIVNQSAPENRQRRTTSPST